MKESWSPLNLIDLFNSMSREQKMMKLQKGKDKTTITAHFHS